MMMVKIKARCWFIYFPSRRKQLLRVRGRAPGPQPLSVPLRRNRHQDRDSPALANADGEGFSFRRAALKVEGAGVPCSLSRGLSPSFSWTYRSGWSLARPNTFPFPLPLPSCSQAYGREIHHLHSPVRTTIGEYKDLAGGWAQIPSPGAHRYHGEERTRLLRLPPAPPPGSASPASAPQPPGSALPPAKQSARFYAQLLGEEPRPKNIRQVPQSPGVPNAGRRLQCPTGVCISTVRDSALSLPLRLPREKPFVRGTPLLSGSGSRALLCSAAAVSAPAAGAPALPAEPQGCTAWSGGFHVLWSGEWAWVAGLPSVSARTGTVPALHLGAGPNQPRPPGRAGNGGVDHPGKSTWKGSIQLCTQTEVGVGICGFGIPRHRG